jgi:uncharacterized membrane protein
MRWPSLVGAAGSLLAGWLSLTPSLLPRPPLVQGVTTGLAAAVGLGVAELLGWLVREVRRVSGRPTDERSGPGPVARRRPVVALVAVAVLASAVVLWCWSEWQQDLRALMDMPSLPAVAPLVVALVAPVVAASLVLAGRVVRRAVTAARAWLVARLARPAVVAIEAVVVLALAMLVLSGVAIDMLTAPVGAVYAQIDRGTAAGVSEPSSSLRSGGPGSSVDWDGLGLEGRSFVAGGPRPEELRQFAGGGAREPIRVYAGLRSADDVEAEARLVVEELDRTGAWDRHVVAVYTSTGTGLVDPDVADSLELLWGGDTAIASMQYSYLPSWLAFLGDRQSAADAGRVLIDAVRSRWEELPPEARPELVVVGESLGSYGTESAFRDAEQLAGRVDAAYLIGPPFMSPIWQELVEERDPDSPVWLPEVGAGEEVRFANGREQLVAPFPEWVDRRILYLDHGSDPVTWWSPDLAWSRPEWLEGERAPDVSDAIVWLPVVTFLQTAVDLANAQSVPVGHGHRYGATIADGWAALLPPPGWTQGDTERLHDWMQRR